MKKILFMLKIKYRYISMSVTMVTAVFQIAIGNKSNLFNKWLHNKKVVE